MPEITCFYRIHDDKVSFSTYTTNKSYITDSVRRLIKNRIDISKKIFQKRPEQDTSNQLILKFNIEDNYQYTLKIYKNYNAPITENDFNGFTLYSVTDLFKLQASFNYSYSSVLYTQFRMKLFIDKFYSSCIDEYIYPSNQYIYVGNGNYRSKTRFYHTNKLCYKTKEILDEYRPKFNSHLKEIFNQLAYKIW